MLENRKREVHATSAKGETHWDGKFVQKGKKVKQIKRRRGGKDVSGVEWKQRQGEGETGGKNMSPAHLFHPQGVGNSSYRSKQPNNVSQRKINNGKGVKGPVQGVLDSLRHYEKIFIYVKGVGGTGRFILKEGDVV